VGRALERFDTRLGRSPSGRISSIWNTLVARWGSITDSRPRSSIFVTF